MKKKYFTLGDIAHARSGDKGNHSNIGVIAYTEDGYEFIKKTLTASKIKKYFSLLGVTSVEKFEMENILAINFFLKNTLGGGAGCSLRIDTQGKILGTAILEMEIDKPKNYKKMLANSIMKPKTN